MHKSANAPAPTFVPVAIFLGDPYKCDNTVRTCASVALELAPPPLYLSSSPSLPPPTSLSLYFFDLTNLFKQTKRPARNAQQLSQRIC